MNAWQTQWTGHKMNGAGSSLVSLSRSPSLSSVPTMGSVCMPGRISMREEGGGDDGGRGGVLGEPELAAKTTINGGMKITVKMMYADLLFNSCPI